MSQATDGGQTSVAITVQVVYSTTIYVSPADTIGAIMGRLRAIGMTSDSVRLDPKATVAEARLAESRNVVAILPGVVHAPQLSPSLSPSRVAGGSHYRPASETSTAYFSPAADAAVVTSLPPVETILPLDGKQDWTRRLTLSIPEGATRRNVYAFVGPDECVGAFKHRLCVPLGVDGARVRFMANHALIYDAQCLRDLTRAGVFEPCFGVMDVVVMPSSDWMEAWTDE